MSDTSGIFFLSFCISVCVYIIYIYDIYIYIYMNFFLSETAYYSQTDSWCSSNVATDIFFSLVDRATVQHGLSLTGLTHLGLTARWESLHDTALLFFSSSSSSTLCVSRPVLKHYIFFSLSLPQLFLLVVTKEGCGDAKKKMVLIFLFVFDFLFFFFLSMSKNSRAGDHKLSRATVRHMQYHSRFLMSTFWVLFSQQQQP